MANWKKAGFGLVTNWIEVSFVILLAAGFVLGKLLTDSALSFFIILAAGLAAARLVYLKRDNDPLPFKAISAAFLVGFIVGNRAVNDILLVGVFATAAFLSYQAHKRLEFLT